MESKGLRSENQYQSDLQSKQVVHSADDDIDGSGAACLSSQVVLKIWKQTTETSALNRVLKKYDNFIYGPEILAVVNSF